MGERVGDGGGFVAVAVGGKGVADGVREAVAVADGIGEAVADGTGVWDDVDVGAGVGGARVLTAVAAPVCCTDARVGLTVAFDC